VIVLDNIQWFEVLKGKSGRAKPTLKLMGLGKLVNEKARMLFLWGRGRGCSWPGCLRLTDGFGCRRGAVVGVYNSEA